MPEIANWNGHSFTVSANLIRGMEDLTIKGACETTTKNADKQKYEERKYGEAAQVSMTVGLNALVGITDVRSEAMAFVEEAKAGASAYFYMGGAKLIPAQLRLKSAQIEQVLTMPGNGAVWISCKVNLEFVQGSKNDGSGSSSSSPSVGSKKSSAKSSSKTPQELANEAYMQYVKAKAESAHAKGITGAGLEAQERAINATKVTTTGKNTASVEAPTTGRTTSVVGKKSIVSVRLDEVNK